MRIVVSEFVSLDGVAEDPDRVKGFQHGGWAFRLHNQDVEEDKKDELFAADAMLLGRTTYQSFAATWPSITDQVGLADRMNNLPKYVASSTLDSVEWNNSHLLSGDVIDAIKELKRQPGRNLLVRGSLSLVRVLARHDLIDLYRLTVYPVALAQWQAAVRRRQSRPRASRPTPDVNRRSDRHLPAGGARPERRSTHRLTAFHWFLKPSAGRSGDRERARTDRRLGARTTSAGVPERAHISM